MWKRKENKNNRIKYKYFKNTKLLHGVHRRCYFSQENNYVFI